jgi:hypothetical protein
MKGAGARGGGAATFSGGRRRRPPSSRVAERATIRATAGSEDIPVSGRERAEGFPLCCAVAVVVSVADAVAQYVPSERTGDLRRHGAGVVADTVAVATDTVTLPKHRPRPQFHTRKLYTEGLVLTALTAIAT